MPPSGYRVDYTGESRQLRQESGKFFGRVLVGGMTIGTAFTLLIVPSLCMLFAREHQEEAETAPEPA